MSAKYQTALEALEAVERCVKAGRDAANASPEEFMNALSASSDSANVENIPAAVRENVGRIAVSIFLFVANVRESAQVSARGEIKRAQDSARDEIKRAQDSVRDAIKSAVDAENSARVKIELAFVGLIFCVAAFVAFCRFGWKTHAFGTLLCALYILGFPSLFALWVGGARRLKRRSGTNPSGSKE